MINPQSEIIIVIGPTSSGKSELAVKLAKRFNGEIISCDSRQIYKGMDLGTGKVEGNWQAIPITFHPERVQPSEGSLKNRKAFLYKTIPHHLIDFINPKKQYSAALFQIEAKKVIADIVGRGKLPILCGGTAHWIDAVVYNQQLPDVKPNPKLRKKLERLSAECLFARISRLDPQRAKSIDKFNKRRLIRALEIVITTGKPIPALPLFSKACPEPAEREGAGGSYFNALWIGINPSQKILFSKIKKRLKQRLDAGMIKEVERLHRQLPLTPSSAKRGETAVPLPFSKGEAGRGLSWKKLESFGLEYKFVSLYLQKKLNRDEMFEQLFTAIKHYTKRQMTWWKKNKEIKWVGDEMAAKKLVENFLQ